MNPISIYIHWPFCLSLCPYCDFNSHIATAIDHSDWLEAYRKELAYFSEVITGRKVRSIFFGGGTPSLMPPKLVDGIIQTVASQAIIDKDTEITLEANPTSYETKKFEDFKVAGINRVSIGVQSLKESSLKALGRKHSSSEAIKAIKSAAKLFERYSFDLIYAIPGQSLNDWQEELAKALKLANGHISLYQLTIEKGTPFFKLYNSGKLTLPTDDDSADMYEWTNACLYQQGYNRYEISNYATPGNECMHNLCYWNYGEYIGVGPGAHSRLHRNGSVEAVMMTHKPENWLQRVGLNGHGVQTRVQLSSNEIVEEAFMMGMRLEAGVSEHQLHAITGKCFSDILDLDTVKQYQKHKLVIMDKGRIRLSAKGLLLHSYLVPRMLIVSNL
ncbi:MAG: radical SAM family heme chaperone HemW [Rickettsiaceae bacterium]